MLDGQTVKRWHDLSGRAQHLEVSAGAPTYIQPGPGFGGLPVVDFEPSDFNGADHLALSSKSIAHYPFTLFAVVRSDTTHNAVIFSWVNAQSRDKMAGIRFVAEGKGGPGRISLFRRNPTWVETASKASFHDNTFHVVCARFISPTLAELFVDGELQASSTEAVPLPAFNRFDLANNGREKGTTDPFQGQIAELLVYETDLAEASQQSTENYLQQKWITGRSGIAISDREVDFGSVARGEPQFREVILTHVGADESDLTIQSVRLAHLAPFTLDASFNGVALDLADPASYPIQLSRARKDELHLRIGIHGSPARLDYLGNLVIVSDAENEPELEIPLKAQLRDRSGVPDYRSHSVRGNVIDFELEHRAQLRLTLNTDSMVRVQYAPNGDFRPDDEPDHFMVQKHDWPTVDHQIIDHGAYWGIHTPAMTIRAQKSPFRLQMFDASNRTLIVKDADAEGMYSERNLRGVHRMEREGHHARFGFGSGDHGHSRPLNKSAGYDEFTVTHGRTCVPFFMSTAGYGIFLNTIDPVTSFDGAGGFQTQGHLDYWYMAGDMKRVLGLYSELTGHMDLFPKWAFGFMLSKYGNDHATQSEFLEWIQRLRKEDYPTDAYVFDFGWRGGKFSSHRWDADRFPDLPSMFSKARKLGFHVGLHNNQGTPEAGDGNFSDPKVAEAWWQAHWTNVIQPGYGDWFWPDEFDVSGDNLMANLSAKIVHERWLQETTEQRPMFMTRGGFANQHFAATWSGDIANTIAEMSEQITGSLALGMSGYPWCSHDLGGFFTQPSDELYIRWVAQLGAFSPIMRAHGHDGREPWLYGQRAQENLRRYLKIRYRLFPYIYSTAWQGASEGIPMMRAMALEHPQDPESWSKETQYYFGDWLLVAPALSTHDTQVSIWLPEGQWYDFFNPSIRYEGGKTLSMHATLDEIPVLVKEGAIIPTGPDIAYADEKPLNPLTLELFPGSSPSHFCLYEDDGITRNHLIHGADSRTHFSASWAGDTALQFTKHATQLGNPALYSPNFPRDTILHAHHWTLHPEKVLISGSPLQEARSLAELHQKTQGWFWDRDDQTLSIRFVDNGAKVQITASSQELPTKGDRLEKLREAENATELDAAESHSHGESRFEKPSF
nr:TIM-barrel domain-containing protein [Haloferula luteola]